ncbi:MAG TPA: protein translocase SEC61 complex subunit gamma [Candidatus Woesearchaeota archaeon]|nr:protein translocase SEC61 complex subunit gamma [Candidatus Woesearchaeota archaeon]
MNFKSLIPKFKSFVVECKRVFRVTKKPSSDEFKTIVKASGLGMIIIGLIGFMIHMVKQLFF